jgi:hypothetical protein
MQLVRYRSVIVMQPAWFDFTQDQELVASKVSTGIVLKLQIPSFTHVVIFDCNLCERLHVSVSTAGNHYLVSLPANASASLVRVTR